VTGVLYERRALFALITVVSSGHGVTRSAWRPVAGRSARSAVVTDGHHCARW
jgi:hypothetical protein